MPKITFTRPDLQERFEKYGYIIVKNFLSPEEISHLWKVYHENEDVVSNRSFYISQWSDYREKKFKINDAVQKVLVPKAQTFLDDYTPVFAVMGVKHPKPDSAMYLHGDWTHVDESKFRTVNVWCPLLNITANNGAVCVIKGSNRLFNYIRGAAIPDAFHHIGEKKLDPYLTDIYLEAGDAIMWDHAIIHGSRVNVSKDTRVAAIVNMRPAASSFYLYFAEPPEQPDFIEVYEPPQDFFLTNDSANDPMLIKKASKFIERIPYQDPKVFELDLINFLQKEFPGENEYIDSAKGQLRRLVIKAKHLVGID
jgi:ectoine hydroxylase-related dioxygenase (phytanoyl-CoA dioxygenase family)